jgi:hypothetical protein
VTLGLCGQLELDEVVRKAAEKKAKDDARKGIVSDGPTLRPAAETGAADAAHEPEPSREEPTLESVFGDSDED